MSLSHAFIQVLVLYKTIGRYKYFRSAIQLSSMQLLNVQLLLPSGFICDHIDRGEIAGGGVGGSGGACRPWSWAHSQKGFLNNQSINSLYPISLVLSYRTMISRYSICNTGMFYGF